MPLVPTTTRRRAGITVVALVFLLFAALSIWYGARAAWSDAGALSARWLVNQWRDGRGPAFAPKLWQQTRDDLQAALQIAPGNAQLLDDLGFLYAARAQGLGRPDPDSEQLALQRALLADAAASYRAAAALRPTFPYTWVYLALAKHLLGEHDAEFWHAFDKGLQYGHSEAAVQPALGQIAFAQWSALGVNRQRLIAAMVATAQETPRKQLLEIAADNGVALSGIQALTSSAP